MLHFIQLLFLAVLLLGCQASPKEEQNKIPQPYIDDSKIKEYLGIIRREEANEYHEYPQKRLYPILYIGPMLDSIQLELYTYGHTPLPPPPMQSSTQEDSVDWEEQETWEELPDFEDYTLEWDEEPTKTSNYRYYEDSTVSVEILVDTTRLRAGHYLVYLRHNHEEDSIIIGFGNRIPLQLEAKSRNEDWTVVEKFKNYHCGMGVSQIFLPPNYYMITAIPKPEGDSTCLLRLALGQQHHSAPFWGKIKKKYREN